MRYFIKTAEPSPEDYPESKHRPLLEGAAVVVGAKGVHKAYASGELTGRQTLYHATPKKSKIIREGLKSKYSTDPNNVTNQFLQDVPMSKKKGKVYMAKKPSMAFGFKVQHQMAQKMQAQLSPEVVVKPSGAIGIKAAPTTPKWAQ